jgi:short-subunit dehydrogenase
VRANHGTAPPGFTRTEWTSKNNLKGSSVPSFLWMESDEVATIGFDAAKRGTPVAMVSAPAQRVLTAAFQMAPRAVVGRFLSSKRKAMST